jgi:alkanesulfonate monooxygenase
MGIKALILSGYPHLDECDMFARYVLPHLDHAKLYA